MKNLLSTLLEKIAASRLLSFGLIAGIALISYAPALNGELLWDDSWLVGQNPFFKSPVFIFEVFKHYLYLEGTSTYYRPVQNISYMPDYWFWNTNVFGYHLSNIFFHALSGWLSFRLIRRLLAFLVVNKTGSDATDDFISKNRDVVAFIVALIWTVHPIHNAGIAYISGRADSLAAMFAVAGWLVFLKAREWESIFSRTSAFVLAWLLCVLAVCSKEIAVTWFALFVLFTFAFDRTMRLPARFASLFGILLAMAVCLWLRHLPHGTASGAPRAEGGPPLEFRGILMLRALGDYVRLIFFPAHLHMDRTVYHPEVYRSVGTWQSAISLEYLSILGAATIVFAAIFCRKNSRGRCVRVLGACWFLIGFLPISNLFPLNAQVAEHWIYMPSGGFLVFLGGCLPMLPKIPRTVAVALALVAIPAFVFRTSQRAFEWADPERFYKQTIDDGGGSARVHLNLALVYSAHGDMKKAEKYLRRTLEQWPDYLPAKLNLGINLLRQGRDKEAEPFLKLDSAATKKVAREQPHTWSAALNMAHMRHNEKKNDEALAILNEATPIYPDNWDLVELRARILREEKKIAAALSGVESFARAHWWHYESHMALARLRAGNGDAEGAITAFREAARLDVHAVMPFTEIAHILAEQKKYDEAAEAVRVAIRRDPDQPTQYLFLASLYEQLGRNEDAANAMKQADELRKSVRGNFRHIPTGGEEPTYRAVNPI